MSQISTSQLPLTCLVVWQTGWTFVVELRVKRQVKYQLWCKTFGELVHYVTFWEGQGLARKQTLPTYLLDGTTQRCEPLSYERAWQLAQAAQ